MSVVDDLSPERTTDLQQLHHTGGLVKHLLELVKDDVVAVTAAGVRSDRAQGKVEALGYRVPLDRYLQE